MTQRDYTEVAKRLQGLGIDLNADFHALPSAQLAMVQDASKSSGYRKHRNASGSTARSFFAMLTRRHGWRPADTKELSQ